MLKIKNHNSDKLKFVAIAVVAVTALGGAIAFTLLSHKMDRDKTPESSRNINDVDYGPPKETDSSGIKDPKKTNQNEQNTSNENSEAATTKPNNSTTGNASEYSIAFTQLSQDEAESMVYIRALASGTTQGSCLLELTKSGSAPINKKAPLSAQASYVICKGFNIPTSEFSAEGEWSATIFLINSEGQRLAQNTERVVIKK